MGHKIPSDQSPAPSIILHYLCIIHSKFSQFNARTCTFFSLVEDENAKAASADNFNKNTSSHTDSSSSKVIQPVAQSNAIGKSCLLLLTLTFHLIN